MRTKKLLAAFLLGAGLCFVPALGYGEVQEELLYIPTPLIHFFLSQARIDYIMKNPTIFLNIQFFYDPEGKFDEFFPEGIDTKDKIFVSVNDNRNVFSRRSRKTLLKIFKKALKSIYSFVEPWSITTDMDTDIVAQFCTKDGTPLGYFYEGEYHLWGE